MLSTAALDQRGRSSMAHTHGTTAHPDMFRAGRPPAWDAISRVGCGGGAAEGGGFGTEVTPPNLQ